jgi:hypothetical protein
VKNNELWCRICNVSIDFDKKSKVTQHLDTKTHKNLTGIIKSNKKANFENKDRNDIKKEFSRDLMSGFASANIPVHKLENKHLRKVISNYLEMKLLVHGLLQQQLEKRYLIFMTQKRKF